MNRKIRAGLIGSGHFGAAVVTQSASIPGLTVPIICDIDTERARRTFMMAEVDEAEISLCDSPASVRRALESGRRAVVAEAALLIGSEIDVVVESTGTAGAGAANALACLESGKHLVMVNKESDSAAGPALWERFQRAGLDYTPADGDQHGLLISLVAWARSIGLALLCGGKFRDDELVYDDRVDRQPTVSGHHGSILLDASERRLLGTYPDTPLSCFTARRDRFRSLDAPAPYDLCELVIAANATGLLPAPGGPTAPVAKSVELADLFADARDTIEIVTNLRRADEAGGGGGVFVIVSAANSYSREILRTKGLLTSLGGDAHLIVRPYHLCGVETLRSVLDAGRGIGNPGLTVYRQRCDLHLRVRDGSRVAAGERVVVPHEADEGRFEALFELADPEGVKAPAYLAGGCTVNRELRAGEYVSCDCIEGMDDRMREVRRGRRDERNAT